jgi:hypothetical protein
LAWSVQFHDSFDEEFKALAIEVQDEILAVARLLQDYGPALGRPHADTLKGSAFANMKELRMRAAGGVWRVAFAFDPERAGILLAAGDKSGRSERSFYKWLLRTADARYGRHLGSLKRSRGKDS